MEKICEKQKQVNNSFIMKINLFQAMKQMKSSMEQQRENYNLHLQAALEMATGHDLLKKETPKVEKMSPRSPKIPDFTQVEKFQEDFKDLMPSRLPKHASPKKKSLMDDLAVLDKEIDDLELSLQRAEEKLLIN